MRNAVSRIEPTFFNSFFAFFYVSLGFYDENAYICEIENHLNTISVMKKLYFTLLVAFVAAVTAKADVTINSTTFPDSKFRAYISGITYGQDGVLTDAEIAKITSVAVQGKSIYNLKGIEYLTAVKELNCADNWITTLNLSALKKLEELYAYNNELTSVTLPSTSTLTYVSVSRNELTSLSVSQCPNLVTLYCQENDITSLNVAANTKLVGLICGSNELKTLDVSHNTSLKTLRCKYNKLKTIDVSMLPNLQLLEASNNYLTDIDVTHNTDLYELYLASNNIISINLTNNPNLEQLDISDNRISYLNLSSNPHIWELFIDKNYFRGSSVKTLISSIPTCSHYGSRGVIHFRNRLSHYVSGTPYFSYPEVNTLYKYQVQQLKDKGWDVYEYATTIEWVEYEGIDNYQIPIDESHFPDPVFRDLLLNGKYGGLTSGTRYYVGQDGILTSEELDMVSYLSLSNKGIGSLQGIEYFKALHYLLVSGNNLEELLLSNNDNLALIQCSNNNIKRLWLPSNKKILQLLDISNNKLESLGSMDFKNLQNFKCYNNKIKFTDMRTMVWTMADRNFMDTGDFYVMNNSSEGNSFTQELAQYLAGINWKSYYNNGSDWVPYINIANGDLNGDGNVNTGDISLLYKAIMGLLPSVDSRFDINGDGNVNTGDISELYKIIMGN